MTQANMLVPGLVGVARCQSPPLEPSRQTRIRTVVRSRGCVPNYRSK